MKSVLSRSRVSRVRLAAAIAAASTCSAFAVAVVPTAALADVNQVKINEVESNGDAVHGDWIELYNTGTTQVDLSGATLTDSDPTHQFVIPAGTLLDRKDYAAFRVDDPAVIGNFGLGAPDGASLYAPGDDPETDPSIDSYSWTSHAPTTYGRNPVGTGSFQVTTAGTFGAPNNFGAPVIGNINGVKLNEVESNDDSTNGDWVELYNTNPTGSVNIDGAIITDSDPAHQFVVPASTPNLAAGGYVAFQVDKSSVPGNFGLGASDSAKLYAPNDVTLSNVIDQFSWTIHASVTYGRDIAGTGTWKSTSVSTFGAVNQFPAAAAPSLTGVVINEAESHGDDTHGDWIELKNNSGASVDLDNAILSDNDNGHAVRIPTSTPNLAVGAVAAFRVDDPALPGNGFGLGDADRARLFKADATDLATATPVNATPVWTTHAVRTYGLNSSGVWAQTNKGTFGAANDFTSTVTPDISDVVLNEVVSTGDTVHGDWVELLNTSSSPITIGGAIIADKVNAYTIPTGTTLAAGATFVFQPQSTAGWGLDSSDSVRLFRAGSTVSTGIPVDHFEWSEHAGVGSSYARQSSGLGDWLVDTTPSFNAAN